MSLLDTTTLNIAGVQTGSPAALAADLRANIFEMTQATEEAVLRPRAAGAWPHDLRAALAARIARLNGEEALAQHHLSAAGDFAPLSDPANKGDAEGHAPMLAFMDKVAAQTRDVTAGDIAALQSAGIADADIVRLAELNAFLAYQIRVVAGLRLIGGAS